MFIHVDYRCRLPKATGTHRISYWYSGVIKKNCRVIIIHGKPASVPAVVYSPKPTALLVK